MTDRDWRISASLILVAQDKDEVAHNEKKDNCDYKVLLVKRSPETAFIANQCVFPGGLMEASDQDIEWMKYFEEFGITQAALKELIIISEGRPQILAPQGTGCYDRFFKRTQIWAREISLRITALRETFEEVGILLCRSREQINAPRGRSYVRDDFDKSFWQKAVHNDSSTFLQLCRTLGVVPDLWGLFEWSVWSAPAFAKKKFDTVFFMAFLPRTPHVLPEVTEVQDTMWLTPLKSINMFRTGELWFLPPQIYELCRLRRVNSYNALRMFTKDREPKGTTLMTPVGYSCSNGIVAVFPGDDFFVENPRAITELIPIELTVEKFRGNSENLHRSENVGSQELEIYLNFPAPDGHLPPMTLGHSSKL